MRPTEGFKALSMCRGKGGFESRAAEAIALAEFGIKTEPLARSSQGSVLLSIFSLFFWHLPRLSAMYAAAWLRSRLARH
jgi:hypothetical protein